MGLFYLGCTDDGTSTWTDLPTLWIGASGSGKSTQFVEPSAPRVVENGGAIIDGCWQLDPETGLPREHAPGLPSPTEQRASLSLMHQTFENSSSAQSAIIDEPMMIQGFGEIWDPIVANAIQEKRKVGIAFQSLEGLPNILQASQHCVIVVLRGGGSMLPDHANMPFDVERFRHFARDLNRYQVAVSYPTGSFEREWQALEITPNLEAV